MEKRLYSLEEVSKILGMSKSYIRQLVHSECITYCRIGNRLKFDKEDIDIFIESHKTKEKENPFVYMFE